MFPLVVRRHSAPAALPEPAPGTRRSGGWGPLARAQRTGGRMTRRPEAHVRTGRASRRAGFCPDTPVPRHGLTFALPLRYTVRMRQPLASPACLIAMAVVAASHVASAGAAPARWPLATWSADVSVSGAMSFSRPLVRHPAPASSTATALQVAASPVMVRTVQPADPAAAGLPVPADPDTRRAAPSAAGSADNPMADAPPMTDGTPATVQAPSGEARPPGGDLADPRPGDAQQNPDQGGRSRPSPSRHAAGDSPHIGHYRVFEHPSCDRDECPATVSDLGGRQSFEASVSLGPMHLARQLEEFARSGQIELLLSGELRRGPSGPTLRALHLEGVTPHAPEAPTVPRPGHAGAGRRAPGLPGQRLLRT